MVVAGLNFFKKIIYILIIVVRPLHVSRRGHVYPKVFLKIIYVKSRIGHVYELTRIGYVSNIDSLHSLKYLCFIAHLHCGNLEIH